MRHRRLVLPAVLALLASAGAAQADFLSGSQLLAFCRSDQPTEHNLCTTYVVGATDLLTDLQPLMTSGRKACLPTGVTSAALVNAVLAHAAAAPQDADSSGAALVYTSVASVFACGKG
jgi:Rap1a immunity proteins